MGKIAIVGVEGSGKTVLMAAMGDKYRTPDENGVFLAPKSRTTYAYCAKLAASLRAGKWPFATESGVLNLDWTLLRRKKPNAEPVELGQLSFLDFGGEIYRLAFGDGAATVLDEQRKKTVKLLKNHVREADALIVLVNLSDIINGDVADERTIEMNWLSQAIITYAFETAGNQNPPSENVKNDAFFKRTAGIRNVALVFSQADTYVDTIRQCGGLKNILAHYLPEVDARYGSRLSLFAVAAVNKTIPASDGSGFPIPAPDFEPEGFEPLLQWMCNGAEHEAEDAPRFRITRDDVRQNSIKLFRKLKKAVLCAYRNYAVFNGRASRAELLWMLLAVSLIVLVSDLVGGVIGVILSLLACIVPLLSCYARRLHDFGVSGWWIVAPAALCWMWIGWIALLVATLLPSNPGENKYGPEVEPF